MHVRPQREAATLGVIISTTHAPRDRRATIRTTAIAGAAALALAACGPADEEPETDPEPIEEPDDGTEEFDDEAGLDEGLDDDTVEDEEPSEDTTEEDATEEDATDNGDDEQAAGAAPLNTEETTDISERESVDGRFIVTDVRVGTHDGFDRLTVELDGEGEAGWFTELTDEPTSQGSGEPIEFEGDIALWLAASTVTLPGDAPEGVDGDARVDVDLTVAGPEGGVITEVVGDTLFEGIQTFAIGLDQERPYRIDRLEDPERIVIDVLHG